MACYHPLHGYRGKTRGASGKRPVVFSVKDGFVDLPVIVPCGQCDGCRLERSRQWAMRCVHEASLYEENCFITLTLSDKFLPADGSLDKTMFQKFMKRLRKAFPGRKIRYYHCGEYGAKYGRPHYHACLFGFDFPDKLCMGKRKGFTVWRSPELERLWEFGNSEIGSVTFESAAYVARYIMKKVTGPLAQAWYLDLNEETGEVTKIEPEYTTMSRGGRGKGAGGIGKAWLNQFMDEVYRSDSVIMRGRPMKPPRFYDDQHELVDAPGALEISRARRRARRLKDETPERLAVREKCAKARLALFTRGLEE